MGINNTGDYPPGMHRSSLEWLGEVSEQDPDKRWDAIEDREMEMVIEERHQESEVKGE